MRGVILATAIGLGVVAAGCRDEASPGAADAGPQVVVATCATSHGEVQVRRLGQVYWEPAATGVAFRRGDWVRTGRLARARIEFLDGGTLEVDENTTVVVDLRGGESGRGGLIAVKSGKVVGDVLEAKAGATFPITFQTAAGQRVAVSNSANTGALAFEVTGTPDGARVSIRRGLANLRLGDQDITVTAGEIAELTPGETRVVKAPDFPESLEPTIDARLRCGGREPVALRWQKVPEAAGYRVQVAQDLSFQRIELSEETRQTAYDFVPPSTGVFVWRVAAFDAKGRFSDNGFARRIFCESEEPTDLLLAPADGAAFPASGALAKIAFSWSTARSGAQYRLIVARGVDLKREATVSRVTAGPGSSLELAPGEYYWGVYSVNDELIAPLFLKPRKLVVTAPAQPRLSVPRVINRWGD